MRLSSHHSQLTEILVEGNENTTFVRGSRQDFIVPGIGRPVPCPNHIVPCGRQWGNCPTRDAGIQEKFHEAVSRGNGSIRS